MSVRALFAACCVWLAATPALADVHLFTRVGSIWITDPSFDLVSGTDALPNVLFGAGWEAGRGSPLAFEVAYGLAGASDEVFEAIDTNFLLQQLQGAAIYRRPFSERWRWFARGAAALEHASLDLGASRILEASAWGLALEGTLGTELLLPIAADGDEWGASLGLSVEAGYGLRPFGFDFAEATVEGDDEAEPPPTAAGPIDVGTLDASGPILRFGLSLRF